LETPRGKRQLIVLVRPAVPTAGAPGARRRRRRTGSLVAPEYSTISSILSRYGAAIAPLFPASAPIIKSRRRLAAPPTAPASSVYNRVTAKDENLDEIAKALQEVPAVEAAYVKPAPEPALNNMTPRASPSKPTSTPDFSPRQDYLAPAPTGIDAHYAWTLAGGKGSSVNIVDVEGEWRTSHEDLGVNCRGVLGGVQPGDIGWRNHGTAIIGTCIGADNGLGITGICPDATLGMVSIFGPDDWTSSAAITQLSMRQHAALS